MVRNPGFHYRGMGSIPGQVTKTPCAMQICMPAFYCVWQISKRNLKKKNQDAYKTIYEIFWEMFCRVNFIIFNK